MRDAGNSWSEIAKTFPTRTEGSVKKHWYKVCGVPPQPFVFSQRLLPFQHQSLVPENMNKLANDPLPLKTGHALR